MSPRALGFIQWSMSIGAVLTVLTSVSVAQPSFVVAGFDMRTPLARWELPGPLREVSGLAAFVDGQVLAHGDERADVFAIDYRTGHVVRHWEMGSPVVRGDFEGISIAGDRVTLMTSDGRLTSGALPASGSVISPLEVENSGLGRRCELEGLTVDARGQSVLPCKVPRRRDRDALFAWYGWPPGARAAAAVPVTVALGRQPRPMAPSAIDRTSSGSFIVLFGSTPAIGEFGPGGEMRSLVALDRRAHPQPEGVALTPDDRLIIADEGAGTAGRGRLTVYGPVSADAPIDSTVILVGDAGAVSAAGDPVLVALSAAIARAPDRTTVVFLGDNIYPNGLPPASAPGRPESERRLMAQVNAARDAARVVFLPGNHDWSQKGQSSDWDAVRWQGERLAATGAATLRPQGGCPGPEVVDIGERLRLIALDTEWWLHGRPAPALDLLCVATTADAVTSQLDAALATAGGRHVIVAGHHPPVSAGPHGGHFGLMDHLFPLRTVRPWLWLPLPIIGSAYPLARQAGATVQDQSHPVNRRMIAALRAVIAPHAPLLFAAGHEHQLGLFTGASIGTRYVAVSGAGMRGHKRGAVGHERAALFADRGPGFMRVDLLGDGRVRLTIVMPLDTAVGAARTWWLS